MKKWNEIMKSNRKIINNEKVMVIMKMKWNNNNESNNVIM